MLKETFTSSTDIAINQNPPSKLGHRKADHEWRHTIISRQPEKETDKKSRQNLELAKKKLKKDKGFLGFLRKATRKATGKFKITEGIDINDVVSKLKSLDPNNGVNDDTVTYGVEDDEGNIMKIVVRASQSKSFESRLAQELSLVDDKNKVHMDIFNDENINEKTTTKNTSMAELLYNLMDEFDVVDVSFPTIPTDVVYNADKATTGVSSSVQKTNTPEEAGGAEIDDEIIQDDEILQDDDSVEAFEEEPVSVDPTKDILNQVLDMLKAQSKAMQAQAEAEAEKAKALQAEFSVKSASLNSSQQEEMARMESTIDAQKQKEKDARKMAEYAKIKAQNASSIGENFSPLISLLLEFDDFDTQQSLAKQEAAIRAKYKILPTDSPEIRRRKNDDLRFAIREIALKKTRAISKERQDKMAINKQPQQVGV